MPERGGRSGWRVPRLELRGWLAWLAAAGGIAVVAFLVGRAGSEVDLASPTPSPSQPPLTIVFGTALDPVSGEAVQYTERFRSGDEFAYSVRLTTAAGVDGILVEITRVEGESRTVVQRPSRQGVLATSSVIAFKVTAAKLLKAWGEGDYTMAMYLSGAARPFATGRFTLVETPAAS